MLTGIELQPGLPTLGEVIRSLQGEVVRVALIGSESDARVGDVAIFDATDPHSIPAGGIVLGVGLSVTGGDAIAAVDSAGRAGAAALVFRTEEEFPGRLAGAAGGRGRGQGDAVRRHDRPLRG